jgi:Cu(I)/Ag(I) efflux system membrane fusion protein
MNVIRKTGSANIFDHFPRKGPALFLLVGLIVVAFSLGLLINSGGNGKANAPSNDHNGKLNNDFPSHKAEIWTCSMHPQIKLPSPGKCPICFMDLIPLEQDTDIELGERQLKMSEAAAKLARISTTPAVRKKVEIEISLSGKISYDETRLAYITARVAGRIDSLYADYTGIRVKSGDPLVKLYSPELISAQEELINARKAYDNSMVNIDSKYMLPSTGAILGAAREKLRLLGLAEKQIETIERADKPQNHITIVSPINGVVIKKDAIEGMYVETGSPIYAIADLARVWAIFDAFESDLSWLKKGQAVRILSLAFPGDTFNGKIAFIDPFIEEGGRSTRVRVKINNNQGKLKPGMFVNGVVRAPISSVNEIVGNTNSNDNQAPLVIPVSAPLLTGKRAVVYIQVSDTNGIVYEGREIELGPRAGDYYIVKEGLSEGDLVVTSGAFKIDSELQIQAKPSLMSPESYAAISGHDHGQPGQEKTGIDEINDTKKSFRLSRKALATLTPVYDAYFAIQMALADDDLMPAKKSYGRLKEKVQSVDMNPFSGEAYEYWMKIYQILTAESQAGSDSPNLEKAREYFYGLSKAIINLHDRFGHAADENYYLTFCPMADSNKGAFWLQDKDTVYNSFYGQAMLRCGSIEKTFEPQ